MAGSIFAVSASHSYAIVSPMCQGSSSLIDGDFTTGQMLFSPRSYLRGKNSLLLPNLGKMVGGYDETPKIQGLWKFKK